MAEGKYAILRWFRQARLPLTVPFSKEFAKRSKDRITPAPKRHFDWQGMAGPTRFDL